MKFFVARLGHNGFDYELLDDAIEVSAELSPNHAWVSLGKGEPRLGGVRISSDDQITIVPSASNSVLIEPRPQPWRSGLTVRKYDSRMIEDRRRQRIAEARSALVMQDGKSFKSAAERDAFFAKLINLLNMAARGE